MAKIDYQGELITLTELSKRSGRPISTLARHRRELNTNCGNAILESAKPKGVPYKGGTISLRELSRLCGGSDDRTLNKHLALGKSAEDIIKEFSGRAGKTKTVRLTPSQVLDIYTQLFYRERSQRELGVLYKVDQSCISDIWTHTTWGWLVAPLRYELESRKGRLR